jgi:cobalt/nickel transport system permease protein/cobalt/nickel transport protein
MTGSTDTTVRTDPAPTPRRRVSTRALVLTGILVSLVLAGIVSFYASSSPDGLESVAEKQGFATTAGQHATDGSPFAGYGVAGIENARLSGGLAGVIGVLVVAAVAFLLFRLLARRKSQD